MTQLTWENMNPIDTSKYLDAIQKAQAQSVAGVEQIGNAYKGYQDNLKKQNTNDMLTTLNQAQNPEQLAAAQENIAAMQQRWGSGYDMDAVRTAMDERPSVLMQRQSTEMDFNDKKASIAARPTMNAMNIERMRALNMSPEAIQQAELLSANGGEHSAFFSAQLGYGANDRSYTADQEQRAWDNRFKDRGYKRGVEEGDRNYNLQVTNATLNAANTIAANQESPKIGYDSEGNQVITSGGNKLARAIPMASQLYGAGTNYVQSNQQRVQQVAKPMYDNYTNMGVSSKGAAALVGHHGRENDFITTTMNGTHVDAGKGGYINAGISSWQGERKTAFDNHMKKSGFMDASGKLVNSPQAVQAQQQFVLQEINTNPRYAKSKAALNNPNLSTEQIYDVLSDNYFVWDKAGNSIGKQGAIEANAKGLQYASTFGGGGGVVMLPQAVVAKMQGDYNTKKLEWSNKQASSDKVLDPSRFDALKIDGPSGNWITANSSIIIPTLKGNETAKKLPTEVLQEVVNKYTNWRTDTKFGQAVYDDNAKAKLEQLVAQAATSYNAQRAKDASIDNPLKQARIELQQAYRAAGLQPPSDAVATKMLDMDHYTKVFAPNEAKEAVSSVAKEAASPKPEAKKTPTAAASPKPTPKASTPKAETKAAKPTKQDVVAFYVKRGEVGNVVPNGINSRTDRQLIREAQAEAAKQLAAKKVKQTAETAVKAASLKAEAEAKKALLKAEAARVSKEFEAKRNARQKTNTPTQTKPVDMAQMYKTHMQQKAKE